MASITKLRTSESIRFFDHSVALSLVQAFHQHLDLYRLLNVFWSQSAAMVQASSLRYRNPDQNIEEIFGHASRHSATYNLSYQNEKLGEITFTFARRVDEGTLATAEVLIALVMPAVKNALAYGSACGAADLARGERAERPGTQLMDTNDGLVLVGSLHLSDARISSQLTASMGVSCTRGAANAEQVLQQARAALAEARKAGSNSVRVFRD